MHIHILSHCVWLQQGFIIQPQIILKRDSFPPYISKSFPFTLFAKLAVCWS